MLQMVYIIMLIVSTQLIIESQKLPASRPTRPSVDHVSRLLKNLKKSREMWTQYLDIDKLLSASLVILYHEC